MLLLPQQLSVVLYGGKLHLMQHDTDIRYFNIFLAASNFSYFSFFSIESLRLAKVGYEIRKGSYFFDPLVFFVAKVLFDPRNKFFGL